MKETIKLLSETLQVSAEVIKRHTLELKANRIFIAALLLVLPKEDTEKLREILQSLAAEPGAPPEDAEVARLAASFVGAASDGGNAADTGKAMRLIPGGKDSV